ncbi:MAG: HAMP domain-containing sensor histidine kinase [Xenococcaceae cyanobacterium MO_188.B32]|nr:HAMP domain-containing sensor histidine kinase [Xenococcaceae cyanobacterium MO_188.B32]
MNCWSRRTRFNHTLYLGFKLFSSFYLTHSDRSSNIIIKVKDTGIGIAPEHLDKIFERFWRAEKSRSCQAGKSGLGLAIVKEIVRQHQGAIAVESQLEVGSCFTVRLPIKNSKMSV